MSDVKARWVRRLSKLSRVVTGVLLATTVVIFVVGLMLVGVFNSSPTKGVPLSEEIYALEDHVGETLSLGDVFTKPDVAGASICIIAPGSVPSRQINPERLKGTGIDPDRHTEEDAWFVIELTPQNARVRKVHTKNVLLSVGWDSFCTDDYSRRFVVEEYSNPYGRGPKFRVNFSGSTRRSLGGRL